MWNLSVEYTCRVRLSNMDPRVIWTPPLENIWYLLQRTHCIFHKKTHIPLPETIFSIKTEWFYSNLLNWISLFILVFLSILLVFWIIALIMPWNRLWIYHIKIFCNFWHWSAVAAMYKSLLRSVVFFSLRQTVAIHLR